MLPFPFKCISVGLAFTLGPQFEVGPQRGRAFELLRWLEAPNPTLQTQAWLVGGCR